MVIVWGSKLMGKCDVVPGLFHVATKFGHLWYLPLIPMGSWIVTEQSGDSWRGVPISLSIKSIGLAWARTMLFIIGMGVALYALIIAMEGKRGESWIAPAVFAALAWGLCIVLSYTPLFTRASFSRAMQLATEAGFNENGMELIEQIYGQLRARGFDLTPPAEPETEAATSRVAPSRHAHIEDNGSIPLEPLAEPVAKQTPRADRSEPLGLT